MWVPCFLQFRSCVSVRFCSVFIPVYTKPNKISRVWFCARGRRAFCLLFKCLVIFKCINSVLNCHSHIDSMLRKERSKIGTKNLWQSLGIRHFNVRLCARYSKVKTLVFFFHFSCFGRQLNIWLWQHCKNAVDSETHTQNTCVIYP
jgi:hypothetical protein